MAKDRYPVAPAPPVTLNPNRAVPNVNPSLPGPVGAASTSPANSPLGIASRPARPDEEPDDDDDDEDDEEDSRRKKKSNIIS